MKEQEVCILWQKTKDEAAKLFRVYAKEPEILLPAEIEHCPIEAIAPYCFAAAEHLPDSEILVTKVTVLCEKDEVYITNEERIPNVMQIPDEFRVLCGDYVKKIVLPPSVTAIGSLAFYNCLNLEELSLGKELREVGSDAFMNCRSLKILFLYGSVREKSGLQQILNQISSGIDVAFLTNTEQVKIFYPEYQEFYDEIAPAHIFGRNIEGEGFRARQSFTDGIVDLARYDLIFPRACVEENETTLLHLAKNRLLYPVDLRPEAEKRYEDYVKAHAMSLLQDLVKERALSQLEFFCKKKYFEEEEIEKAVVFCTTCEWAEGVASLLEWKRMLLEKKEDRYAFDEF